MERDVDVGAVPNHILPIFEIHYAYQCARAPRSRLPLAELRAHPSLILAIRITLRHFWASASMSCANSVGELVSGSPPTSANRALILGSVSITLISRLSFSMTAVGVFL